VYSPHRTRPLISTITNYASTHYAMYKYIVRRLLVTIPVLIGVTIVISSVVYISPGNPARLALGPSATPEAIHALEQQRGLNRPPHIRYLDWMAGVLQGDLGVSIRGGREVSTMIAERIVPTIELAVVAMIITLVIALPLGVISAVKQ